MKLIEQNCREFSEQLASHSPTPGGGSAAAMIGSYGAALSAMVANFTIGREKYAEHEETMKDTLAQVENLRKEFLAAVDADAEAYSAVGDVLKMPKSTPEEKAARKESMQNALKKAALIPLHVMELSQKALQLTSNAVGVSNPNVSSDLGVAALSLRTALCGAWLNVLINLSSIKDEAFTKEYRMRGESLVSKSLSLADEIYEKVLHSVGG